MIRNYRTEDVAEITRIFNHYVANSTAIFDIELFSESQIKDKMEKISGLFPCYVYEENGELIGFSYAHPWKTKEAYSSTLETTIYIKPGHEGKGIGRLLMSYLINDCKKHGYTSLIACVTEENIGSVRFHEQLGFKKASLFKRVGKKFDRELDVIDLQLLL